MMGVAKVIWEGELPISCNTCPFSLQDYGEYFCISMELDKDTLTMSNMIHVRPDWCPLITKQQYTNEIIIEFSELMAGSFDAETESEE
jgi:hypothetical protein